MKVSHFTFICALIRDKIICETKDMQLIVLLAPLHFLESVTAFDCRCLIFEVYFTALNNAYCNLNRGAITAFLNSIQILVVENIKEITGKTSRLHFRLQFF